MKLCPIAFLSFISFPHFQIFRRLDYLHETLAEIVENQHVSIADIAEEHVLTDGTYGFPKECTAHIEEV